MAFEHSGIA
uniref:Uncharacterized protein n=1 Tax=Anguilla anguilla TaxID=7936 RepID=A0A0E9UNK9_ANGAN